MGKELQLIKHLRYEVFDLAPPGAIPSGWVPSWALEKWSMEELKSIVKDKTRFESQQDGHVLWIRATGRKTKADLSKETPELAYWRHKWAQGGGAEGAMEGEAAEEQQP